MTYRTKLPFGAEIDGDRTRFRLWAPSVDQVDLVLPEAGVTEPMTPAGGGWFETERPDAPHGTPYAYRMPDGLEVPDPAARAQKDDVHGPSLVVDPRLHDWAETGWRGRPWHETVLYELHVGTFSPEGTFEGARKRLKELKDLGVTAVELMPVADFPGRRSWGYDGVLHFAPDRAYGTPAELKMLVDEGHRLGLQMFLDVVYNHFGPDGNYLHVYAKEFFTEAEHTPWGAAIDFTRAEVRNFFIANTLYWLEEFRFDGLRFDAVHAISDDMRRDFLGQLGRRVGLEFPDRHVHLVLENDANEAKWMRGDYHGQWNDDIHHAGHVVLTKETGGYYRDYKGDAAAHLGRALAEGFIYQGEASPHRGGEARGERSADLAPHAFVGFLQNHDQVGNRAMGERLSVLAERRALEAMTAIYLLAPHIPMLFMGEEVAAKTPFYFFCDFNDELAQAVREGRRREFSSFPEFASEEARERIPDPNDPATFEASRPPYEPDADGRRFRALTAALLRLRHERIVPHLGGAPGGRGRYERWGRRGLTVRWELAHGTALTLVANLSEAQDEAPSLPDAPRLTAYPDTLEDGARTLPGWSVLWYLDER